MTQAGPAATGRVSEAIARLEAELAALWAPPDPASGEPGKVRASTMNLVVVSVPSELERLREATDELNQTHAGRAFLVTVDPRSAPWEIQTAVSAVCRTDGGATPICADRIELSLGAMVAPRAGSILGALALSEVPTVLEIERGAPPQVVESLARAADRIVVDSAHTGLDRLAALARSVTVPIADRAFVRGFSWRELTARFFDDAPLAARAIRRVEVGRTAGGADPARLFVGWLASRLGWRLGAGPGGRGAVDAAERPLEIALRTEELEGLGPGELTSVRIATELGGGRAARSIERIAPRVVRWSIEGGGRAEVHEHPLGYRDETWVLIKAIDSTESDRVYREALLAGAAWSSD